MPEMMSTPVRIQRRRTKGWRMPDNTVSVTRPGLFGNPFRVGTIVCHGHSDGEACDCQSYYGCASAAEAVAKYAKWRADIEAEHIRRGTGFIERWLAPLRGRNLACFCKLCPEHRAGKPLGVTCDACEPCHVDVLLELANA